MAVNTSERQILRKTVPAKNSARERQLPRTTMTTDDTTRREQMSEVMTSNCSRSQMDLAKQANKYLLGPRHSSRTASAATLEIPYTNMPAPENWKRLQTSWQEANCLSWRSPECAGMRTAVNLPQRSRGSMEFPQAITVGRTKRPAWNDRAAGNKAGRHSKTKYLQGKA